MKFHFLHLLDRVLGKILLMTVGPLCNLIAHLLPRKTTQEPKTISILKLHGGGSLLIAMPALLGLRARYPDATITLIGTSETEKYADLTGAFDKCVFVNSGSFLDLLRSGFEALIASFRQDVLIDLEPHSALAAVFTALTFSARRIGLVDAHEVARKYCYSDAVYFNPHAPIYVFYDQIASLLGAEPASSEACRDALRIRADTSKQAQRADHPRPVIYASAFTSSLAPERMLPAELWAQRLREAIGEQPFTLILGGSKDDTNQVKEFAAVVKTALPKTLIISTCGAHNLRQAVAEIDSANQFWGVDSGPLHLARLLGKKCVSFWGPSNPAYRLRPIDGLDETVFYKSFPCSPCVHLMATAPCKGDNQCMKQLFAAETKAPVIRL